MRSSSSTTVATVFPILYVLASVYAQSSDLKTMVYKGCFTSSTGMTDQGSYTYQSPGYCQTQCVGLNKPVMGTTKGSDCYCGDLLPPANSKVSDSECNTPCNGYDQDTCGGSDSWSVQLTGLDASVGSEQSSSSESNSDSNSNSDSSAKASSSSSERAAATPTPTKKQPPSVVTKASTIVVTAPGQTSAKETIITTTTVPPASGPNKAAIAAGVVVGIVALSAIAGGVFFFLRNRKRRAVEEEYRRNLANGYGSKPPNSSGGSISDSRLDPVVMMQRRQSDGSIADNQDYSRRILKVTNPDGT